MNATTDPGAGPFPLGYGDPRNALLPSAGTTPDCGPHCPDAAGDANGVAHCSCPSCHGKPTGRRLKPVRLDQLHPGHIIRRDGQDRTVERAAPDTVDAVWCLVVRFTDGTSMSVPYPTAETYTDVVVAYTAPEEAHTGCPTCQPACGRCGGPLAQTPEPWCDDKGRHGLATA